MTKVIVPDLCPAFYVNERGEVHTTGVYITPSDDTNIHVQLKPEIEQLENEPVTIINQVDHFSVHVECRFSPIGRIYVLAMLNPTWRP